MRGVLGSKKALITFTVVVNTFTSINEELVTTYLCAGSKFCRLGASAFQDLQDDSEDYLLVVFLVLW